MDTKKFLMMCRVIERKIGSEEGGEFEEERKKIEELKEIIIKAIEYIASPKFEEVYKEYINDNCFILGDMQVPFDVWEKWQDFIYSWYYKYHSPKYNNMEEEELNTVIYKDMIKIFKKDLDQNEIDDLFDKWKESSIDGLYRDYRNEMNDDSNPSAVLGEYVSIIDSLEECLHILQVDSANVNKLSKIVDGDFNGNIAYNDDTIRDVIGDLEDYISSVKELKELDEY